MTYSDDFGLRRVNAFTTGNPFLIILLGASIERDFGALKGLRSPHCHLENILTKKNGISVVARAIIRYM